ncbi:phosphoglyceromutase, partial [Oceanidesulfovibrio marinus]
DKMCDDEISQRNIPTSVPRIYELDADLKPKKIFYLGDTDEIAAR